MVHRKHLLALLYYCQSHATSLTTFCQFGFHSFYITKAKIVYYYKYIYANSDVAVFYTKTATSQLHIFSLKLQLRGSNMLQR